MSDLHLDVARIEQVQKQIKSLETVRVIGAVADTHSRWLERLKQEERRLLMALPPSPDSAILQVYA